MKTKNEPLKSIKIREKLHRRMKLEAVKRGESLSDTTEMAMICFLGEGATSGGTNGKAVKK